MHLNHPFILLISCVAGAGCGVVADGDVTQQQQAIRGGADDGSDKNVVAIVKVRGQTLTACSGSLIAPNLVLTARHCVGDLVNAPNDQIDCARTTFAEPDEADDFLVTTEEQLPQDADAFHTVRKVVITAGDDFCGSDIAMLVLSDNVSSAETLPLLPGVDVEVKDGDVYSAVGYGAAEPDGTGVGTRRRLDGLSVLCIGGSCSTQPTLQSGREFLGGDGPCQGDSGGPALDEQSRVIGVASRASSQCGTPIYSNVAAFATLLRQTATNAADLGGYPAPSWATSSAPATGGCSAVDGAMPSALVAGALTLLVRRRRLYR